MPIMYYCLKHDIVNINWTTANILIKKQNMMKIDKPLFYNFTTKKKKKDKANKEKKPQKTQKIIFIA